MKQVEVQQLHIIPVKVQIQRIQQPGKQVKIQQLFITLL